MIKMFVSDFDGTLVGKGTDIIKGISNKDILSINSFTDAGGVFVIATGRHPFFIKQYVSWQCPEVEPICDIPLKPHAVIGFSGNLLLYGNNITGERFGYDEISLFNRFRFKYKDKVDFFICDWENNYYYSDTGGFCYRRKSGKTTAVKDYRALSDIIVSDVISSGTNKNICRAVITALNGNLRTELADLFFKEFGSDQYALTETGPIQLEIVRKHRNKASEISALAKKLGINKSEIAVAGDDYNDVPMFLSFPCSFCMGGAENDVKKEAAKIVCSVSDALEMCALC